MKEFFDLEGPFFRTMTQIVDLVYVSLLFLLCCIPVFTAGASMTALYYTVHKTIKHGHSYVTREFFGAFKRNFKQATLVWLLLMLFYGVVGTECYLMYQYAIKGQAIGKIYIVLMVVIALVVIWNLYLFPYIARFSNSTKQIMKNAAFFAAGNMLRSVLLFVLLIFFVLLVVSWPGLVFVLPGLYAFIMERGMEKIYGKYMSEEDKKAEEERNREYKN